MRVDDVLRKAAGWLGCLAMLAAAGCGQNSAPPAAGAAPAAVAATTPTQIDPHGTPVYTYEIVHTYPHDTSAFTEGLVYLNGELLESTGLKGQSSLRRVDLTTGRVLQRFDVAPEYFAEGLTVIRGKAYQLTWESHVGFVYDLNTFRANVQFNYTGEGWGLTTDGFSLIMSDGTDQIRFLDPATFTERRRITVLNAGNPLDQVNELEYVNGVIYANVWKTDDIVEIDPQTGNVKGIVDFSGLLTPIERAQSDVLNGIAYDSVSNRLFVTGKLWPKLFEVRLKAKK
jgi:glutamine cyclotransferase